MKFKEVFLNEGTTAAIIVKIGDKYSMSYAQYDGMKSGIGREIRDYFYSQKGAEQLVSKTGEIRGIDADNIEFYNSRTLLKTNRSEKQIVKLANEFSTIKYYWDGQDWSYVRGNIKNLEDIHEII